MTGCAGLGRSLRGHGAHLHQLPGARRDGHDPRRRARRGRVAGHAPGDVETQPASAEGSRRALLDQVDTCDALLLLVGAEYGEPGARGISPTEEEFQQARERNIDVLALVQDGVDRVPAQQEFLGRVRGTWERGNLTANFTGPGDVTLAVVKTLTAGQRGRAGDDPASAAAGRALELARGDERRGMHGRSKLRIVVTPVLNTPLIDAVALGNRRPARR